MIAEVISIGTELLLGQITDTNAASVGKTFAELGISVYYRQTIGDNLERVTNALKLALSRSDFVLTIGGLGPTEDDLTREAIAAAIGEKLEVDQELEKHLIALFDKRKMLQTSSQIRQAMRPPSSRSLPNSNGTAPGLLVEKDGKLIAALPGPPNEFNPMLEEQLLPLIKEKVGGSLIKSKILRMTGIGESVVEEKVKELIHNTNPTIAPLAHLGEVHLRITAKASSAREAEKLIAPFESRIRELLGETVYGVDGENLEDAVVAMLTKRNLTVAFAESCTGGLLSHRVTNVPGSSTVFMGGFVTYTNAMKARYLSVNQETLNNFGAVSHQTASEMAKGVREEVRAEWGVGITGIAGPDGGSKEKPVGLVYIAVADGLSHHVEEYKFIGNRTTIKQRASQAALTLLRKAVMKGGCENL